MDALARFAMLLVLAGCGGRHRRTVVLPPEPCTVGTHGGLASSALAWGNHGGGALTVGHGAVFLREYGPDGEARDERTEVLAEASVDPRLALGRDNGAWLAVVAPRGDLAHIVRVQSGGASPVAHTLEDRVTGHIAVVPWQGQAAVFYTTASGPRM